MTTTDLVWIVGGPADEHNREELRYSIRSVTQNLRITWRDLWIIGDPPTWYQGCRIPLTPKPGKFENQRASITAYVNHPDAADTFVLLNDDMYVIEPTELVTCRYLNPLSQWAAVHNTSNRQTHEWDCWQCHIIDTAEWTAQQTGTDPWIYEAHTPLLFNTAKLRHVLANYPTDRRFVVGEVYPIAGAGGEGHHCGNAKVKRNTTTVLTNKLRNPMPYLSGSPESWPGVLGDYIRPQFPTPSPWEQ